MAYTHKVQREQAWQVRGKEERTMEDSEQEGRKRTGAGCGLWWGVQLGDELEFYSRYNRKLVETCCVCLLLFWF